MEVSSGLVSSGTLSSAAEEGPRGLPLVNRPIMFEEADKVQDGAQSLSH